MPKENQMDYYPEDKIPFVWIIDDTNIFLINSYRHQAPLCLERVKHSSKSALSFVNYIINSINQNIKISLSFCIDPQYERAGLFTLRSFDSSLMGNHLKGLHREFQDWLRRYGNSCEVVVHGWNHYNPDYLSDGFWNTMPGVDYNRRSEWYKHPDSVRLFGKCVKALTNLGYIVETSVFSSPGGRVDVETLRKLRVSKYKVIGKYCTQPENLPVDFKQPISEKPIYLKSIDVLIFVSWSTRVYDHERIRQVSLPSSQFHNARYRKCLKICDKMEGKSVTSREIILMALNRKKPDRVPLEIKMTPGMFEMFKEKTRSMDFRSYFNMDFREVEFNEPRKMNDFSRYFPNLPAEATITEWGIARIPGSMPNYHKKISPLSKITSIKEIEEYPFPDFKADYRHQHLEKEVEGYHQSGLAAVAFMEMTIFERTWRIRGMENFMIDMISNSDIATVLLDKITEISLFMAQRFAESDVDIIKLGDDIGTQEAMIMHPDMWRKWLKSRLAEVIRVAKEVKPEVLIYYHTDGFIEPVIPDLIEIGVDVLNPVQPECMNPVKLKKKYGSRLSFWGTIGTQTTMPFGTPEEVRRTVKRMIETVGKDGGLLIAPTHVLEPDVPWENILAFVDAVNDYGYY